MRISMIMGALANHHTTQDYWFEFDPWDLCKVEGEKWLLKDVL